MTPRDLARPTLAAAVVLLVLTASVPTANSEGPIGHRSADDRPQIANPGGIGKDVYFKMEAPVSGLPAPNLTTQDYPVVPLPLPLGESRLLMWVFGQQHLYFAAFVLGALFWIMALELASLLRRQPDAARRDHEAARDVLGLVMLAVSGTAISGAVLLLAFISLYPGFAQYLFGLFRPFVWFYGLLFVAFSITIYLYYYLWHRMVSGFSRWIHATLGVVVNVIGNVIMMIGSSWGSFMTSPAGVDEHGRFLGDYTHVLHHALWNPLNVHRFASHLIFGAAVIAAYAGYRALKSEATDRRTFYNWMCHAALLALFFALVTVPFGGYWLLREIYAYRQQMGISLLGGLLAWISIVLVILMGLLFLAVNYYLWRRIEATPRGASYRPHAKWIFLILAVSFIVYMPPHTLVMRAAELEAIGGQRHPVVGNYGVESSKQPAVNIMIAVTMWSLIVFWRSRYELKPGGSVLDAALIGLFVVGGANAISLGIMGYYIPANVRVGLSVPMVMTTLHIIVVGSVLTFARVHSAIPLNPRAAKIDAALIGLFVAGAGNIIWLQIIGRFVPMDVRVGLVVLMVMTTLHIIVLGSVLAAARVSRAKELKPQVLGPLSWKGYLAVLATAAAVTWLMAIGGYQRSSVRLFWHAMEIVRDNSPWAFTHTIGVMGNVMAFNTLLFWSILLFLVWLRSAAQGPSATISETAPATEHRVVGGQITGSGSRA